MGSIDPYAAFRIFHEIRNAAELHDRDVSDIAFMIDQSHNLKPKIEATIQTVTTAQEAMYKGMPGRPQKTPRCAIEHEMSINAEQCTERRLLHRRPPTVAGLAENKKPRTRPAGRLSRQWLRSENRSRTRIRPHNPQIGRPTPTPEKLFYKNPNFFRKHVQNFHPLDPSIEGYTFFQQKKPTPPIKTSKGAKNPLLAGGPARRVRATGEKMQINKPPSTSSNPPHPIPGRSRGRRAENLEMCVLFGKKWETNITHTRLAASLATRGQHRSDTASSKINRKLNNLPMNRPGLRIAHELKPPGISRPLARKINIVATR